MCSNLETQGARVNIWTEWGDDGCKDVLAPMLEDRESATDS
jgi:hypothetical protein